MELSEDLDNVILSAGPKDTKEVHEKAVEAKSFST
jgi:hypothetical protein